MKYDDASWHYGGDYPKDLPPEAGGTHIGMFVAWAMMNGLAGAIHTEDFPDMLAKLQSRELRPGEWFLGACDEKFTNEDLIDEGNAFALHYYGDPEKAEAKLSGYLTDYVDTFPECDDLYSVPDTWESYDRIAPVIARRFIRWRNSQKGWRRFIPTMS